MQFDGKFERARQLAAAFGLMGLMNVERVSSIRVQHAGRTPVSAPLHGPRQPRAGFRVSGESRGRRRLPDRPGRRGRPAPASGPRHRVLLSDFLTFGDLDRPLNMLFSAGLEVFAVQILARPSSIPN